MENSHSPDQGWSSRAYSASLDARKLTADLREFAAPRTGRSLWELSNTLVPFFCVILGLLFAIDAGYFLALAMAPVAGLLLLRLFIIQHDCGHGSFLRSRSANDWIGRALGALTFTPYDCWKRSHALHHATTGNLDARGFGDIDTWTVGEFHSRGFVTRFFYRLYRHPVVLFGIGPAYLFLLRHRLPIGLMKQGPKYWVSAMVTNLVTASLLAVLVYFFGIATTLWAVLPPLLIAASAGVWLFYIQHQFEEAHWDKASNWSFHEAALFGSSHLDLPQPLRWFTGNIGVHNVHHLASRIPFYRLTEVLNAFPEIRNLNRFTVLQTFRATLLGLWDEEQRTLVTFREARSRYVSNQTA